MRPSDFLAESAPAEIVVRVFRSCASRSDLLALMLTCHRLHKVWIANWAVAVRSVLRREIPHFEEVLIAVRLARLVPLEHVAFDSTCRCRDERPALDTSPAEVFPNHPALSLRDVLDTVAFYRIARIKSSHTDDGAGVNWSLSMHNAFTQAYLLSAAIAGPYHEYRFKTPLTPSNAWGGQLGSMYWSAVASCYPESALRFREHNWVYIRDKTRNNLNEAQKAALSWLGYWLLESVRSDCEEREIAGRQWEEGAGHLRRPSPGSQVDPGMLIFAEAVEALAFASTYSEERVLPRCSRRHEEGLYHIPFYSLCRALYLEFNMNFFESHLAASLVSLAG